MAQELTFRQWVIEGYKYKRFREEFIWCLEALLENLGKVVSQGKVGTVKEYIDVIDKPFEKRALDQGKIVKMLRDLRSDLAELRKDEGTCTEVYKNVVKKFKNAPTASICVSRTKTALDLLSRYLRGIDQKYATQAEYIRHVYLENFHKIGDNNKLSCSVSGMLNKLMLVSPPQQARYSISRALKNKRFRKENEITDVERENGNLVIYVKHQEM